MASRSRAPPEPEGSFEPAVLRCMHDDHLSPIGAPEAGAGQGQTSRFGTASGGCRAPERS